MKYEAFEHYNQILSVSWFLNLIKLSFRKIFKVKLKVNFIWGAGKIFLAENNFFRIYVMSFLSTKNWIEPLMSFI